MTKCACDRCGKEIYRFYKTRISYTGADRKEPDFCADLCKECNEEFLNWMKNEPVKDDEKKIEDYERTIHGYEKIIDGYKGIIQNYEIAIHSYRQQIKDLTEHLAKQGQIVIGDENYERVAWDGKVHIVAL